MHDSFVHTIMELHENDTIAYAPIDFNGPLHSNWASLSKSINQPIIVIQLVHLIA
jgi:hypothetical protein